MFNNDVSAELQEILEIELHRYKREIGHMTKEEWGLLVDWVYSGHSPYKMVMVSLMMTVGLWTS
jgi:hypothetical protein